MDDKTRTNLSKFFSLVLRHRPGLIGIRLNRQGWVAIELLLAQCHAHGRAISRAMMDEVVQTCPKRRFAVSEDGLHIRASQGHSVDVELGYEAAVPPEVLFHGTVVGRLELVRAGGIRRMKRNHVHLSPDPTTAKLVGERRGEPVVLHILAGAMHRDGYSFYLSANGVWLTHAVPATYIDFPKV